MDKSVLTFDEVSDIFESGTVWVDRKELYWYQYAWSLLEKQGKTIYSNEREKYNITLQAFVLIQIYREFCNLIYGEYVPDLYDTVSDFIPDTVIIQLVARYLPDDEIYEDISDLLNAVLPFLKSNVFKILNAEMNACDAFVWMYCTTLDLQKSLVWPDRFDADHEVGEEDDPDDDYYEINSYEDYKQTIAEVYDSIVNDCEVSANVEAYSYLTTWMPDNLSGNL